MFHFFDRYEREKKRRVTFFNSVFVAPSEKNRVFYIDLVSDVKAFGNQTQSLSSIQFYRFRHRTFSTSISFVDCVVTCLSSSSTVIITSGGQWRPNADTADARRRRTLSLRAAARTQPHHRPGPNHFETISNRISEFFVVDDVLLDIVEGSCACVASSVFEAGFFPRTTLMQ